MRRNQPRPVRPGPGAPATPLPPQGSGVAGPGYGPTMPSPAGTCALLEAANGPARLVVTTSSAGTGWTVARCGSLVADTAIALYPFEQLRSGDFQLVTMDLRGLTAIDGVGSAVLGARGTGSSDWGRTFESSTRPIRSPDGSPGCRDPKAGLPPTCSREGGACNRPD